MTATSDKLAKAVEAYCVELHRVRASGGATGERSSYGPLANRLSGVGATLKPISQSLTDYHSPSY